MTGNSAENAFAPDRLLVAVVLALLVVRLVIGGSIGLSDDEAYYRIWALAPALSYLDHPPVVAYMIALGRALIGDTALGIRVVTIVAFTAGVSALWRTARILFSADAANAACWLLMSMPLLAIGGIITTPDAPSVLFSGLVMWAIAELHRSQNANWWLAVGAFAGLGVISKYTNLFVGSSVLIWVLTSAARRQWLRSWQFWMAGAIAAAITTPVVIWNALHGWASFAKQFSRVVRGHGASVNFTIEMAGGFFALASPLIAALAVCGVVIASWRAIKTQEPAATLVVASIMPGLAYFALHATHSRVQANWLAPLYPPFAICAALALDAIPLSRLKVIVRTAALGTGFASIAAVYAHAVAP
ncbi:MAG: glycosyltransferase family 39 protein, partial [Hyphomicrobium sp.]